MNIYKFAYFGKKYYCKDGKECLFCSFTNSGNEKLARLYRKDWGILITYLDGEAHSGYCLKEDYSIDPDKENKIEEKAKNFAYKNYYLNDGDIKNGTSNMAAEDVMLGYIGGYNEANDENYAKKNSN